VAIHRLWGRGRGLPRYARNDGPYRRHREAAGRGDPSSSRRGHGLPRFARNDGFPSVIARPQAVAIHRRTSGGVDCRAALAMTARTVVIARPKAVAIQR
jgi:hypothetical protein